MNTKELAELLNNRTYRKEITSEEEAIAKQNGIVVVFGASDDLMEFRGAIQDEVGCYDGGTAYLDKDGLLTNDCDDEDCPAFARLKSCAATIKVVWCDGDWTWTYKTAIPHETFEIMDEDEKYCIGIVFKLEDVKS